MGEINKQTKPDQERDEVHFYETRSICYKKKLPSVKFDLVHTWYPQVKFLMIRKHFLNIFHLKIE